jgi:hypothetical protein
MSANLHVVRNTTDCAAMTRLAGNNVSRGEIMSRIRKSLGVIGAVALLATSMSNAVAQESPDAALRAQMAAITLERASLPGDYRFQGETFLDPSQVAGATLDAGELDGAGLLASYASVYRDPNSGHVITSYVSAWEDADAASAGFEILEDESRTNPDGSLTDGEATVGETPRETTTGTYPDPADPGVTVGIVDTTFRIDRFLVGLSLTVSDGSEPDAELVESLAGTLESRATAAVGNENPEGTDLSLVPQVVPLAGFGQLLQAGFLDSGDVEEMYGLRGSALGQLEASWAEVVGLGEESATAPYIGVGLTTFASAEDAQAVLDQAGDLAPGIEGATAIEGVEIEGADAVTAISFPSPATGAAEADSVRVLAVVDATLIAVDVQGAPSVELAQETAVALATAQTGCVGADFCEAPSLPEGLTTAS